MQVWRSRVQSEHLERDEEELGEERRQRDESSSGPPAEDESAVTFPICSN